MSVHQFLNPDAMPFQFFPVSRQAVQSEPGNKDEQGVSEQNKPLAMGRCIQHGIGMVKIMGLDQAQMEAAACPGVVRIAGKRAGPLPAAAGFMVPLAE